MESVQRRGALAVCLAAVTRVAGRAAASVSPVGPEAFAAAATFVDFKAVAGGTEVIRLAIDGLSFAYGLGNGKVSVTVAGSDPTNNAMPPRILSNFKVCILSVALPSSSTSFGYGHAIRGRSRSPPPR